MTGGCPRTPDWVASGRRVKCAAGVGGDGDRIGGGGLVVSDPVEFQVRFYVRFYGAPKYDIIKQVKSRKVDQMAKEDKKDQQKIEFKLGYSPSMKRIYFNRFKFLHENGMRLVRVWYQDEMMRASNAYACIMADEDFEDNKSSIRNYLQKILALKATKESYSQDSCPIEFPTVDTTRMIMCSRIGTRAEIYFGFFPLKRVLSNQESNDQPVMIDVALCSHIDCHIDLLRKFVA